MGGRGDAEERLALRARVAVDENRLLAARAECSAIDPMLPALAEARVIGKRPVDLRRLAVVLLETGAHLALEFALQRGRRREHASA